MALFNFELSVADRALLEAHRQKLGARSAADAIRYLIRGWTGPADEAEDAPPRLPVSGRSATQAVSVRGRSAAKTITVAGKSAAQTVQIGPTAVAPGERLKKKR
jgi:hypothetical protein